MLAKYFTVSLVLVAVSLRSASAVSSDELQFANITAANATKQWTLSLSLGNKSTPGVWTPFQCTQYQYDACFSSQNEPPFVPLKRGEGSLVKLDITYKKGDLPLTTYQNKQPQKIETHLCYTNVSATDRAWRSKNKPYPRLTQNCPFDFADAVPYPSDPTAATLTMSFILDMDKQDVIPTSTLFVMVWVRCTDDTVCAFETTEGTTGPATANFVQAEVYNSITPSLRAAAIILSIICPLFFFGFYAADTIYYKKTGRAIIF